VDSLEEVLLHDLVFFKVTFIDDPANSDGFDAVVGIF